MIKESHRIELKAILTDSLEKEVVAFLNSREGGIIYIGVNDNGTIKGIENTNATQLQIKDRLKNNILPNCFKFSENFLRMTFPNAWDLSEDDTELLSEEQVKEQVKEQVEAQVEAQVKEIVRIFQGEMSVLSIMTELNLKGRRNFVQKYLQPSLALNFIEMTQPDSPKSPTQKYRLTEKGKAFQTQLKK
ncbi:AlbA family DNA-binding domain-containing protein [Perlabentimonas gracilis]|uniref:AlbA family DNA-binding domain-containing protein n=1 Tax=Perlabentimonas gracilis TaxID=2715279 RepID=UPI001C62A732|nr:ATP-binding protein [Perlabentimonas gracilis]